MSLLRELTDHRFYAYRGCAPEPDLPGYSAADPDVPLDAWTGSTVDGGLPQRERLDQQKAAVAICGRCPVLDACRAYGNAEIPDGGLVEPDGIWGGQLPLERHRALIARRNAQPGTGPTLSPDRIAEAGSVPKRRLLRALARERDTELVAYRAGMDVRTANWHRSSLCSLLGLDKESTTREQLLTVARTVGLLPSGVRIVPDGRWPIAAAPTTDGSRQRRLAPGQPVQLAIPGLPDYPRATQAAAAPRTSPPAPRLRLVAAPAARPVPLILPVRTLETAA
ncbi:WhiB family transcriptional regulator [Streptomyces sp. NBC_01353]|uniref:WhiB family transcriptional regulator n=1 Tax=Streptomyces sp. NBC_01353 TaxID=2903835 RepID=UPI002E3504F2|nr:WhiB family transcriptional regulator [Streptomyces sp. NBC_01353]